MNNNPRKKLPVKLNLGCGKHYKLGFINVDVSPHVKTDVVWNLDKYPYPLKDNSVDYILAMAIIEHLEDLVAFMEEAHRILKPGGELRFRTPLAFTVVDSLLTHKQHITPDTFRPFLRNNKESVMTIKRFTGKLWVTPPLLHKMRFPPKMYLLNSFINNIFTGVEGRLFKVTGKP